MKKALFLVLLILLGTLTVATFAMATPYDTIVTDIDPANTGWWLKYGSDVDPSLKGQLINSNEATEAAWAEGILGITAGTFSTWEKIEAAGLPLTLSNKAIFEYNPGFSWSYAVVKYGDYWALIADDGDGLLNTGGFSNGVSHVTFLNPTTSVPEPSILVLLGAGLVGLGALGWRKIK